MARLAWTAGVRRGLLAGLTLTAAACTVACLAGCGGGGGLDKETRIDRADIPRLKKALDQFNNDCGRYPKAAEGLEVLLKAPTASDIAKKWRGPYVTSEEDIKDPWGHVYQIAPVRRGEWKAIRIWSVGRDGQPRTEDDYPGLAQPRKRAPEGGRGE